MNAEQKQRALDLIDVTKTYRLDAEECAMQMAALLQELVDAPEPEPLSDERIFELAESFGEFKYGDAQGCKRIEFARAIEHEILGENK